MSDFEKTKLFFSDFKIPYKVGIKESGYGNCTEKLVSLTIENDGSENIVDGYTGFAVTFLFEQQDENLYKMCLWE